MPCNNAGACADSLSQVGLAQDYYACTCGSTFFGENCAGYTANQPQVTFNTDIATLSTDAGMTNFKTSFKNGLAASLSLPDASRIIITSVVGGSTVVKFYIISAASGPSVDELYATIRTKSNDGTLAATFSSSGIAMTSYDTPDDSAWVFMDSGVAKTCEDFNPTAAGSLYSQCSTSVGADLRFASQACLTNCDTDAPPPPPASCTKGADGEACENGGAAAGDEPTGCSCDCSGAPGFEGANCETAMSCDAGANGQACENGGAATGDEPSCSCDCSGATGFDGANCETAMACVAGANGQECQNGGAAAGMGTDCTCGCASGGVQEVAETGFEGDNCEMPTIPTCVFSEGGVPFSCSAGFIYNSANDMNGRDSTPAWPDACCHTPICSNTDAAGMP
jgi:hypothetical protein